jgi:hypothetical protein
LCTEYSLTQVDDGPQEHRRLRITVRGTVTTEQRGLQCPVVWSLEHKDSVFQVDAGHMSTEDSVVKIEDWWSISKYDSVAQVEAGDQSTADFLVLVKAGHYM